MKFPRIHKTKITEVVYLTIESDQMMDRIENAIALIFFPKLTLCLQSAALKIADAVGL